MDSDTVASCVIHRIRPGDNVVPATNEAAGKRQQLADRSEPAAMPAALRDIYETLSQFHARTPRAQQPWPGGDFVRYWGRPEPWRGLTNVQRRRLLYLAASSNHLASVEVALTHCGCALMPQALAAGAASGSLEACQRLLAEGCSYSTNAPEAAAEGGHLLVLQLLLEELAADVVLLRKGVEAAAGGACAGGQLHVLAWLNESYGHMPGTQEAVAAAQAGQVAVLEHLLALLPECAPPPEAEPPLAEPACEDAQVARSNLLTAITAGCPVEVLQRHYDRLWRWRRERVAGIRADEFAGTDHERDAAMQALLATAAGSATPCWAAKLDFLLDVWGPTAALETLRHVEKELAKACHAQPDYLQRLRRLHTAGMPLGIHTAAYAAAGGHAEALQLLWAEAGTAEPDLGTLDKAFWDVLNLWGRRRPLLPGHLAVFQLLHALGYSFTLKHVYLLHEGAGSGGGAAGHAVLTWISQVATDADGEWWLGDFTGDVEGLGGPAVPSLRLWSRVFEVAARGGAGVELLQALRGRGAAISLAAVAKNGSEETLSWAVAQLEGAGELQAVDAEGALHLYGCGNIASLACLRSRGLLPRDWMAAEPFMPSDVSSAQFWNTQLWIQVQLWRLEDEQAAAAAAAAQRAEQASEALPHATEAAASPPGHQPPSVADEQQATSAGGQGALQQQAGGSEQPQPQVQRARAGPQQAALPPPHVRRGLEPRMASAKEVWAGAINASLCADRRWPAGRTALLPHQRAWLERGMAAAESERGGLCCGMK